MVCLVFTTNTITTSEIFIRLVNKAPAWMFHDHSRASVDNSNDSAQMVSRYSRPPALQMCVYLHFIVRSGQLPISTQSPLVDTRRVYEPNERLLTMLNLVVAVFVVYSPRYTDNALLMTCCCVLGLFCLLTLEQLFSLSPGQMFQAQTASIRRQ